MVCLGNICRSPMAAVVMEAALDDAGLGDKVEVTSSGTGGWHVGEPMDSRAASELRQAGYDPTRHRAQKFDASWFDRDLILAMDSSNLANAQAWARSDEAAERVRLFRSFDPEAAPGAEVPDPWYGGQDGFTDVLEMVERTCAEVVKMLTAELPD